MKNRKKVSEAETIHKSKGEKHSEARRPSPARQTEKTGDQVQAGARPPKGGTPNHFPIVGIGGITHIDDARKFFLAGATAIQVGTTLYNDPALPERIVDALAENPEWIHARANPAHAATRKS